MNTFASAVIDFINGLKLPTNIPAEIEVLNPMATDQVRNFVSTFYQKFYNDSHPRLFFVGINPGRLGAGVTGIQFTDPIQLEKSCGIPNALHKSPELSSTFVYDVVEAYGGANTFYSKVYFTSTYPFGFVRDGKNLNYYDVPALQKALYDDILKYLRIQRDFGCASDVIICMGKGQNYQFLQKLNEQHKIFKEVLTVPHPRWVMQYRLRKKQEFIDEYIKVIDKYAVR